MTVDGRPPTTGKGRRFLVGVRASQINTLLPRFNPGKEFKKVLGSIDFEKA